MDNERKVNKMACFMLKDNMVIKVDATEISHTDGFIIAWRYEDVVAMFRASEIIGWWIEGGSVKCQVKQDLL